MDEDDEYGGDDLDLLPDNALQQLEQNALSNTQLTRTFGGEVARPPSEPAVQTYTTTGLTRSNGPSRGAWRPPQPKCPLEAALQQQGPPPSAPNPPSSSDYGFDEEDVIDLDEPSTVLRSTSVLPSRARTVTPGPVLARDIRYGSKGPLDPETEAAFAAADAELVANGLNQWAHAPRLQPQVAGGVDVSSLQAKIAELEAEQARLRQAQEEARKATLAKQGEIAIVRTNHEKATREYERRIAVMQKLHTEEAAKQKAELEAGRKQREKMETDNRFLQHDLAQESERAKRLTGPGKTRAAPGPSGTPQKAKRLNMGDGFDEDEVQLASPSRSREKAHDLTPKTGVKRKRAAHDSPVPSLSFSRPVQQESTEQQRQVAETIVAQEQSKYSFMQRTLGHRPWEGHERTIEALTRYSFPSNQAETLASALLGSLTSPLPVGVMNLPLKLSRVVLRLWRRCLEEEYYEPAYLLLDMMQASLVLEPAHTLAELVTEAVPICVRSINSVAQVVFKASTYQTFVASPEYELAQSKIIPFVDVGEILDFTKRLCDVASLKPQSLLQFWQSFDFRSMLLILSKTQPITQSVVALRMLATSCMETSFGCVCDTTMEEGQQLQYKQEKSLVERLTSMLLELPQAPKDEPAYTQDEILDFRLEVLQVLRSMCQTHHGGLLLAQYHNAIGRLVRFLHTQVGCLYTTRPALGLELISDVKPTHSLVSATVNATVRLIYHLLRAHSDVIDLQQRLAVPKGSWHKFLVSMTRIAFSDRVVFEAGLDEEIVEAAHQILDSVLTPEEGEAVVKALETPRGTKGTATEKDTESEEDQSMEPG